jgi:hypothetical protein
MCFSRCVRCGQEFSTAHETEHDCTTEQEDGADAVYHGA